ncbi:MAG: hypothetical protein ACOX6P_05315 [Candidatus Merdivicinus sp.]|jgi:hypothetical protein
MSVFYHASPVPNLTELTPHISNHGKPLVYLADRRESVLVYLSNPVERHCKCTGFSHTGPFYKFASYGFSPEGKPVLEEYYPDAFPDTFAGVPGWIYTAESEDCIPLEGIPGAFTCETPIKITGQEWIPDAYEAILRAEQEGLILLNRYTEHSPKKLQWIEKMARQELQKSVAYPEYQDFLKAKFPQFV